MEGQHALPLVQQDQNDSFQKPDAAEERLPEDPHGHHQDPIRHVGQALLLRHQEAQPNAFGRVQAGAGQLPPRVPLDLQ